MNLSGSVARVVAVAAVLVFAFTAIFVEAFHAPRPHGVPVGVVGPPAAAARLQHGLDRAMPGGFDVRRYPTEPRARDALLHTDVAGVLVPAAPRARVLVAGALGAAPAETARQALVAASGGRAVVSDVRPLPRQDPRGLAQLFTMVGTLIPSLLFGVVLTLVARDAPARVRWTAVTAFAVCAGVLAAVAVDPLVGALPGHFAGVAVVTGLLALAVAAATHALGRVGGLAGIGAGVLVLLVLGLSSSGGAVTHRFEPGFYRAISQALPSGAALTALRDVQYFDWAATLVPLLVLGAWAAGAILVGLTGRARAQGRA